jgi:hypothetical protein
VQEQITDAKTLFTTPSVVEKNRHSFAKERAAMFSPFDFAGGIGKFAFLSLYPVFTFANNILFF